MSRNKNKKVKRQVQSRKERERGTVAEAGRCGENICNPTALLASRKLVRSGNGYVVCLQSEYHNCCLPLKFMFL